MKIALIYPPQRTGERGRDVPFSLLALAAGLPPRGHEAVIIDVRGMADTMNEHLSEPLGRFCSHPRIAGQVTVYACGVRGNDVAEWQGMAASADTSLRIEDHFDECVLGALTLGGWRLLPAR